MQEAKIAVKTQRPFCIASERSVVEFLLCHSTRVRITQPQQCIATQPQTNSIRMSNVIGYKTGRLPLCHKYHSYFSLTAVTSLLFPMAIDLFSANMSPHSPAKSAAKYLLVNQNTHSAVLLFSQFFTVSPCQLLQWSHSCVSFQTLGVGGFFVEFFVEFLSARPLPCIFAMSASSLSSEWP